MLVLSILAITLIITISFSYSCYKEAQTGDGTARTAILFGFSIGGWIISAITLIIIFFVYCDHAENLGTIRQGYSVVKVQQDRLNRLRSDLTLVNDSIKQGNVALVNSDSPIKSLIDQIALAETSVAEANLKIANAEVSIAQRKAGPGYFIISWFGEK